MARSFLIEAKLPKIFWLYVIHKANLCMNLLPVTQGKDSINNPALMTTPYFKFFGVKPDYRTFISFWSC